MRERLAFAMVEMCGQERVMASDGADIVHRLLAALVRAATHDLRLRLAQKLACADWAPRELVGQLAHDEIDVAEPVILRSSVLIDEDLIAIARACGCDHRVAVASRPDVSESVTDAVAEFKEAAVLTALARNASAKVSRATLDRCVEAARDHAPLREPLASRPELPPDLAPNLYLVVSQELRRAIAERFELDEKRLSNAVESASQDALADAESVGGLDVKAATLINKLAVSDRLKPSVVVQAAGNGQIPIVEHAMARLAGVTVGELRAAFARSGAPSVALACRAANVPRESFRTVLLALADAGRVAQPEGEIAIATVASLMARHSRELAMDALRQSQHET
ncbi:MAG: DUF2336 domain-containing protein [Caulobacterales bacterium]|nr:DUF2336 domain-containing protein [Caulobacterales bacterium]